MTMLTRRHYLALNTSLVASAAIPGPLWAEGHDPLVLKASAISQQIGPDQTGPTSLWGYNGKVSGPEIRVRQGDRLRVRLDNDLEEPTTIHWHGIRIDNAMDGVAGMTQQPVKPGESFLYDFVVPDAGTFWYHPHYRSWEQVARGLSGPLIVEDAEPVAVDRELTLLIDDWRLTENGALDEDSFGHGHDWSHAGRLGNWPTVNGSPQPDIKVKRHERLRLRLINAANATLFTLRPEGFTGVVAARDGMACPLQEITEDLVLAPAQRMDLIVDVTTQDTAILRLTGRENFVLARFPVTGDARTTQLESPVPLPSARLPEHLPVKQAKQVSLTMEGGAMRWLREAVVGHQYDMHDRPEAGTKLSGTDLAQHKLYWALNGTAGMPADPLFDVQAGEVVTLHLVNQTAFPHVMHWHGHHARHMRTGHWRDSLLVRPGETEMVTMQADNPGDWMLHCHMLDHQVAGMGSWFRVRA